MPLTIEQIRVKAEKVNDHCRPGCIVVTPRLTLRCLQDVTAPWGSLKKGDIIHALEFDENGNHPNTARPIECGFWWDLSLFEFAD